MNIYLIKVSIPKFLTRKINKIMSTQTELLAQLTALTSQVGKVSTEVQHLIDVIGAQG